MSKAITDKQEERGPGPRWGAAVETAPSLVREDEPTIARTIGLFAAACVIFGGLALLLNLLGRTTRVGVDIGWASMIVAVGVVGLLAHAVFDRDLQVRRLYWAFGIALFCAGVMLCVIPFDGNVGGLFGLGYLSMVLALFFLLATSHHESDPTIRASTQLLLLAGGGAGTLVWLLMGNNFGGRQFMAPYGVLLALLSLCYLTAFISQVSITNDRGFRVALGMAVVGLVALLLGIIRTLFDGRFFVPAGLLYVALGLLYLAIVAGFCSDNTVIVLTRRELSSYFFSPIMYLVLASMSVVAWGCYWTFVSTVVRVDMPEPIISQYFISMIMVMALSFTVPVLTMKSISEEKRTGSLELLFTAPVNETPVVLGKFLGCLLLYGLTWVPWLMYLVALRVGGGETFDYRALFSFLIVLAVTGANFVSMGLFFSSLTSNQVVSAVLTFAGMIFFFGVYLLQAFQIVTPESSWDTVVRHMDYINLWINSIKGTLVPKFLLFHLSMTLIWLFVTVKVLEARRWA